MDGKDKAKDDEHKEDYEDKDYIGNEKVKNENLKEEDKEVKKENKKNEGNGEKFDNEGEEVDKAQNDANKKDVDEDGKGPVYYELLKQGKTINTDLYCNQLDKLQLKDKRPALASRKGIVFHHDNARPCTAMLIQ
ncbi:mariner Mos1 transposase [Trichonephila clavipes]|uniref:Mariner Mos1 transposase n=1 Tax=Trichonephila clavipes TaxID=2585209 RepID=A0A8X6UZB0_TRICX|nr:mariner Mos1 transposase [Trichonephila clavipes]